MAAAMPARPAHQLLGGTYAARVGGGRTCAIPGTRKFCMRAHVNSIIQKHHHTDGKQRGKNSFFLWPPLFYSNLSAFKLDVCL